MLTTKVSGHLVISLQLSNKGLHPPVRKGIAENALQLRILLLQK
jgi:hypothetical protein